MTERVGGQKLHVRHVNECVVLVGKLHHDRPSLQLTERYDLLVCSTLFPSHIVPLFRSQGRLPTPCDDSLTYHVFHKAWYWINSSVVLESGDEGVKDAWNSLRQTHRQTEVGFPLRSIVRIV